MEKENRNFYVINVVELIISIIGLITFTSMFILVDTLQRIIFLLAAIYFGFNICDTYKEMHEEKIKNKVKKYSMKRIDARSKRKLSY